MQFKLREFRFPADYPAVLELWQNSGPGVQIRRSDEMGEIQKKLLRDPDLFLIAEVGREIVGTVIGGFDGRRGLMYHLAISPEYRRQGIATQLTQELENRLREKGCIKYYLLVTQDNEDAQHFYETLGWERMNLYVFGKDL